MLLINLRLANDHTEIHRMLWWLRTIQKRGQAHGHPIKVLLVGTHADQASAAGHGADWKFRDNDGALLVGSIAVRSRVESLGCVMGFVATTAEGTWRQFNAQAQKTVESAYQLWDPRTPDNGRTACSLSWCAGVWVRHTLSDRVIA